MTAVAPSTSLIRAHVQRVRRKAAKGTPDAAVGIRSTARWIGADSFLVDGRPFEIVWCTGPLEVRQRLVDYDAASRGLVIVTPLDEHELGADVVARLMRCRLDTVRAWDMLLEQFQARQLDPQVAAQPWIADALLSLLPDGGFEAVPAGILDAATVWKVLLTRKLGFPQYPVDLELLLAWSRDSQNLARYAGLDADFRKGLTEHLVGLCGAAASAILDCIDGGHGADAVPLGLTCRVLFHDSAGDRKASFKDGVVRLEKFTMDRPPAVHAGRQWAAAAESVVRRIQEEEGLNGARSILARGDQLIAELKAQSVAHLSNVLPEGFEQRLSRYAQALKRWLADPSPELLESLAKAASAVVDHDQSRQQQDRRRRVEMSLRLARFMSRPAFAGGSDTAVPFETLATQYARDGGFVDWARCALAGEGHGELAEALAQLAAKVTQERQRQNEQFARSLVHWTTSVTQPRDVLLIESVLDKVVAPLADEGPVLLLVIDGMSYAVYRELLDDLVVRQGWVPLENADFPQGRPVVATIPSATEFSRTSLFCGRLVRGGQAEAIDGFSTHPRLVAASRTAGHPLLFHKAELTEGAGQDLAADLRKAIASSRRVIGVVINAVDDHLLKGDQVHPRWNLEYIRVLRPLLHEATMAKRTLILASDHGHVFDRQSEGRETDRGERWRSTSSAPRAGEMEVQGHRVLADGGHLIALWSEQIRFGGKKNGYHGGLAPQEMLAPLAVLVPSNAKRPPGWNEVGMFVPDWWDIRGGSEEQSAAVPTAIQPPTQPGSDEPPTLFDQLKPGAAVTAAPVPAPDWLDPLLVSPAFQNLKKQAGRTPVPDATIRSFLEALAARGGTLLRPALARQLNVPPLRLPGIVAAMRRLLNFDGVDVLSVDEASDSVVLDVGRLKLQFDL